MTFDEELLAALDADDEVKKDGRSKVLCRAAAEYLRKSRRAQIASQYRKAYADGKGLGEEFDGWESQGIWPSE